MFGSRSEILKEAKIKGGVLKVSMHISHRYGFTKSGRGTIKTKIEYHVYLDCREEEFAVSDEHTFLSTTRKADALKIFRIIAKHGVETYQKMLKGLEEDQHLFNQD